MIVSMFYNCRCVCFWFLIFVLCFVGIPFQVLIKDTSGKVNATSTGSYNNESLLTMFKQFTVKFNKTYSNDTELNFRFNAFKGNMDEAMRLNELRDDDDSAVFGVTRFSDLTKEEFVQSHLKMSTSKTYTRPNNTLMSGEMATRLRRKVDWRKHGVVGKIQDQQSCGGCWAFSTVGVAESMYAIRVGKLLQLSVQQVLDCSRGINMGCEGGDTCSAIEWLADNEIHIVPAKKYPLMLRNQPCRRVRSKSFVQLSSKYTCENLEGLEFRMLYYLSNHGPLVVAVDSTTWQHYLGGTIRFHCGSNHNHAVQIVGYDLTASVPYYIIRNSWGEDFGNNGYLQVAIGNNLCGIANEVSTLDVKT